MRILLNATLTVRSARELHGLSLLKMVRLFSALNPLLEVEICTSEPWQGEMLRDCCSIVPHCFETSDAKAASATGGRCGQGPPEDVCEYRADENRLVVTPSELYLTRNSVETFLEKAGENPEKVMASAHPLHHNRHPSWLFRCPGSADNAFVLDEPCDYIVTRNFPEPEFRGVIPERESIKGSQWLPVLWNMDAALVWLPAGVRRFAFEQALPVRLPEGQVKDPLLLYLLEPSCIERLKPVR